MKVSFNSSQIYHVKNLKPKTVSSPIKKAVVGSSLVGAACLAGQAAVLMSKTKLSDNEFNSLLQKHKYVKTENNGYKKEFTDSEKSEIWSSRDGHQNHKSTLIQKPVTKEEMDGFKEFLELSNGKALKYTDKHLDNLMVGYLNLKRGGIFNKYKENAENNSGYHDLFLNVATKPFNIVDSNYLMDYKMNGYKDLNQFLRLFETGEVESIPEDITKKINIISNYLDTQKVETPVKVYRSESLDVLKNVRKSDGSTFDLKEMIDGLDFYKTPQDREKYIQKIKEFVLDNEIVAHYPAFVSTTVDKNMFEGTVPGEHNLHWEIDIPKGTKGVYLEPLNSNNILSKENEFLIQKNTNIIINSIDYDEKEKHWIVSGKILN